MSDHYVFNTAEDETEFRRLQLLESIYDPYTINWMNGVCVTPGMSCLEVGPGAGSMVRRLSETVGPFGWVTAVDTNPRFVTPPFPHANVEVVKGDLNHGVGRDLYDIVYARFVVVHQPGHDGAIAALIDAIKPGGWLLLVDADFT
ncbi:MAG: methyltransferase domain-containing protein, partial [Nitrospinae bacterium]|nr:methyltransferase domain-containing protein [Nitrospinota bacterium]